MRLRFLTPRRLFLLCFLLAALPGPCVAQSAATASSSPATPPLPGEKLSLPGISNAGRVNDFLYRGAQPLQAGYDQLRDLGISLVIDLHNRGADLARESREVSSRKMEYISIRTSATKGPSEAEIAQFLRILRENPNRKIFVHCKLGADRIGVMIAAYRITEQHWTSEQALAEMRAFHFHSLWLPAMDRTVHNFPRTYASSPAFAALRAGSSPH